jgi:hypothetical protein
MKKLLLVLAMISSFNASAAVYLEKTNPALDSVFLNAGQSSVDTTTGLEWLRISVGDVDYTLGQSINSANSHFGADGWLVASAGQVSDLFNLFFPMFSPGANGTEVINGEDPESVVNQSRNSWILSFGADVDVSGGPVTLNNNQLSSRAMYLNDDGTVGIAGTKISIGSDLDVSTTLYGPEFGIASFTADTSYTNIGVFMVRQYVADVPDVPIPASIWLFGSGLIGLALVSRRKSIE